MVSERGKEMVSDAGDECWRSGAVDDDTPGRKRKSHRVLLDHEDFSDDVFSEEEEDSGSDENIFVVYEENIFVPSANDPKLWKVKCSSGRESFSALHLMRKHERLAKLGHKLPMVSACAINNLKGFIIIEVDKQDDIYEVCKGLPNLYSSCVTAVPSSEIPRILSASCEFTEVFEGMWARFNNGKYKDDLAKVVAVYKDRKKVTVKLVPRIDLKSIAEKIGGGVPARRKAIPARSLITPSELEEFHPFIRIQRDPDTNLVFENLNGMMLNDGYLFKRVSINKLRFAAIVPSKYEFLKFEQARKDKSTLQCCSIKQKEDEDDAESICTTQQTRNSQ